jgi:GntR family transcriptional repressor for pyruvate dehydrogenase complex
MRPPTSNELMELLVRDLLAGRESGDRLPSERETAGRFGVSRPVVREALRALQERGLVEILPGRGTFVRGPSADDLARPMDRLLRDQATPRDLVEARTMLECRTAQLAAERATDADVARIACAYEAFESAASVHDRVRADLAFHGAIAVAAHNPVLDTMFRSISTFVIELMLRSLSDPEVVAKGAPYHGKVLVAIRRRDPKRAGAAMVAHVELAAALYGADYDRSLESLARNHSAFLDTYRPDRQEERTCRSPQSRP